MNLRPLAPQASIIAKLDDGPLETKQKNEIIKSWYSTERLLKICSICHKISARDSDHTDCVEKRRIEMEDESFRQQIPEKLDMAKNASDLGIEVKAILEHLTKEKDRNEKA